VQTEDEEEEVWHEGGFRHSKTLTESPKKHCREKPPKQPVTPVFTSLRTKAEPGVLRSAVILQNCFLFLSGNELSHTVSGIVVSST